ncbi:pseudouridine synthase [Pilobolus umbonatus]|nr:pseudouridine synthase [Pilobolus umbonatus]
MSDTMDSPYVEYTREQLLGRIYELETILKENNLETQKKSKTSKRERMKNKQRPFDMSKYTQRKIALRIAYIGWDYIGFATQHDEERVPTVEGKLFKALVDCKLITSIEESDYTRCGRTDRGVSALGQVIALKVRSKKLISDPNPELLPPEEEIPYIDSLNRMLPPDIRVLAWSPVDEEFSARFSCSSRTYKYYFTKGRMDIEKIRQGCAYFEGDHDFRNFCKLDPSKNVLSYNRIIKSMTVKPVPYVETGGVGDGTDFYEVELKGTAFLWHQVRFMMSVLFLVGQGLEPPEIIRDLVDIEKVSSKPDFPMASDLPLVLYDCEFKDINWTYSFKGDKYDPFPSCLRTYYHYNEAWTVQMIRSLTYQAYLTKVSQFPMVMADQSKRTVLEYVKNISGPPTIRLGGGKERRNLSYKSILLRPRSDSDELKKEKYEVRKKRKLDKELEEA